MVYLLVQHQVKDFKSWKKYFDSFQKNRTEGGELSAQVFHTINNPQDVIVLCKWSSREKLEEFAASQALKEGMQEAGVIGKPHIQFLHNI